MNATSIESRSAQAAAYGGLLDALGGIATIVLAIIGLTGFDPVGMAGIATIVFGAALLVQGGTILTEYTSLVSTNPEALSMERAGGEGLPAMFLAGAAGIVLGVLTLLGIASETLIAVAAIGFGSVLILSSGVVRQLYMHQTLALQTVSARPGTDVLAGQMALGAASVQLLTGIATTVLGILAVAGLSSTILTLAALLLLGVTVLLTGSTLSGLVLSFMRPSRMESRRFGPGPMPGPM